MGRNVQQEDINNINRVARQIKEERGYFTNREVAEITGWSASTIGKYYNENWIEEDSYIVKNYHTTNCSGIYMLKNVVVKNGEIQYLIKVGKASNLQKRLDNYKGMNPTAECVGTTRYSESSMGKKEKEWHKYLSIIGKRIKGTEWFILDKETFDKVVRIGFNI